MACAALAVAVPLAPAAGADTAPTPMALASPTSRTVTLVTGETVTVTIQDGQTDVRVDGSDGYRGYRDAAGDDHIVPAIAQPYLGRMLDPSLFDVSAAVRDGLAGSERIPVSLTFAAGSTPTAPAGVTLTSTSGTTATGYLTPSSTAAFAAALRQRIGADTAAHRQAGSTPFAGLTGMRLAASVPSVVTPAYALYPLHINDTDNAGAPVDNAYVTLVDTDSVGRQQSQVPINGGVGQVEVPAGHYSAIADFVDFDTSGKPTALRQVTVQDFTVAASSTPSTVSVSEAAATAPVTVTLPEQATTAAFAVYEARGDARGGSASDFVVTRSLPVYVAPTAAPRVGTSHFVVADSALATATGHQYDVAFAEDHGVPATNSYTVRPAELATVRQRISSDPSAPTGADVLTGPQDPALSVTVESVTHVPAPGTLTHYFSAGTWRQWVLEPNFDRWTDPWMRFAAGRTYTQDWGHGPLAVDFGSHYSGPQGCYACVGNGYLLVQPNWGADSTPGHAGDAGDLLITNTSIAAYQNGTSLPVDPQDAFFGLANIPQAPTTYRFVFDNATVAGSGHSLSLVRHTDVTVKYAPTTDPSQELTAEDGCETAGSLASGTACQILPILSVNYRLATDLTNTSTAGVQRLGLDIGHVGYDGHGSRSPITSASLAISFDNGTTWRPVPLAGACGHYAAAWPNPHVTTATPGPELKVTAADADGDTITQTVGPAYTIGSDQ